MDKPFPGMDPYLERSSRWPDVHTRLITAICDSIVAQLSDNYIAMITPYVTLESVEIAPARQAFVPDVAVLRSAEPAAGTASAAIAEPPLTSPARMDIPTRYGRIEIRSVTNDILITSIELLSPANKRSGAAGIEAYERKRQEIFQSAVHLLEIDLLRGGNRPSLARPLPDAAYFVFLSRSYRRPMVDVWPIALADSIPVVPVPLSYPDPDVALDLNTILQQVYRNARYDRQIDYREDPPPPELAPTEATWLDALLRERGLR